MKIPDHKERLRESLSLIEESIEKGLVERQRTIGFNASAAVTDMLGILLHKNSLIDPGIIVKHEWLKSEKSMENKFPFDFPRKEEIFALILKIEEKRNILCYGKPQKEELILEMLNNFNKVKGIFKGEGISEL